MGKYAYDLAVIGGGAAGMVSAKLARGLGKKVVIIEKARLGGSCTWTGCIPSKTLLKVAQIAYHAKKFDQFGLTCQTPLEFNYKHVMAHVHSRIERVYQTQTPEVFQKLGIAIRFDEPCFVDEHTLRLTDGTCITFDKCIITTGTSPFIPPLEGLEPDKYLTNESFFALHSLPKSIIVLGGGPIGVELASALIRLGVTVTLIEMSATILPREDQELTAILAQQLRKEGINLLTGARATRVAYSKDGVTLTVMQQDQTLELAAEKLLIAVGRAPNTHHLGLEHLGLAVTPKAIITDVQLRTNISNIYAAGDVVGPYQFSHMAEYQARIAAQNAFIPIIKKRVNYDQVIWVTFTDPELAFAGLSEKEARDRYGDTVRTASYDYKNLDRARTDNDEVGMAKFVLDKRGNMLGCSIVGNRAGEIIHEVQLGKYYNLRLTDIYPVIHAYPTYSEIIAQTAKKEYIQKLKNNPFLKLLAWATGKKT